MGGGRGGQGEADASATAHPDGGSGEEDQGGQGDQPGVEGDSGPRMDRCDVPTDPAHGPELQGQTEGLLEGLPGRPLRGPETSEPSGPELLDQIREDVPFDSGHVEFPVLDGGGEVHRRVLPEGLPGEAPTPEGG